MSDTVYALAIRLGATAKQHTETVFAHPTLSKPVCEAAEGIFGHPMHLPKAHEQS